MSAPNLVAIGIAFATVVCPISTSAQREFDGDQATLSDWIRIESIRPGGGESPQIRTYGLKREELKIIADMPGIMATIPWRSMKFDARHGDKEIEVSVVGTTPEAGEVIDAELWAGRHLVHRDIVSRSNVAVIGNRVGKALFGDENPVGKDVRIGENVFTIVGILESPERDSVSGADAFLSQDSIYIPVTAMMSRFGDTIIRRESGNFSGETIELSGCLVQVRQRSDLREFARIIDRTLARRRDQQDIRVSIEQ